VWAVKWRPGVADLPVVPEAGGECEPAGADTDAEAGQAASAVAFEPEPALAGPQDRFDAPADVADRAEAWLLVAPVGAQQPRSLVADEALEVLAREALVGDDHVAGQRHSLEQLLGHLALGGIGVGELKANRGAVPGAEQAEPETPEVARVRAAVAPAGAAGELGAARALARLAAHHRGSRRAAARRRKDGETKAR
jgi:hypothetical protein